MNRVFQVAFWNSYICTYRDTHAHTRAHAHSIVKQGNLTSAKTLTKTCSFSAPNPLTITLREMAKHENIPSPSPGFAGPLTPPWPAHPACPLFTRGGRPNRAAVWQRHTPERPLRQGWLPAPAPSLTVPTRVRSQATGHSCRDEGGGREKGPGQ